MDSCRSAPVSSCPSMSACKPELSSLGCSLCFVIHLVGWAGMGTSATCTGCGNGARVAAVVGSKCRGVLAGFVLLSYPLKVGPPTLM